MQTELQVVDLLHSALVDRHLHSQANSFCNRPAMAGARRYQGRMARADAAPVMRSLLGQSPPEEWPCMLDALRLAAEGQRAGVGGGVSGNANPEAVRTLPGSKGLEPESAAGAGDSWQGASGEGGAVGEGGSELKEAEPGAPPKRKRRRKGKEGQGGEEADEDHPSLPPLASVADLVTEIAGRSVPAALAALAGLRLSGQERHAVLALGPHPQVCLE